MNEMYEKEIRKKKWKIKKIRKFVYLNNLNKK